MDTPSSDPPVPHRLLLLASGEHDHAWMRAQLGESAWLLTCAGDANALCAALEDMKLRWGRPDRVVALDARSIAPAARLRTLLGLPALTHEDAPALRDRRKMHSAAVSARLRTVQLLDRSELQDWDFRTAVVAKHVARGASGARRLTSYYDVADLDDTADMVFEQRIEAPVCHVEGIAVDGRIVASQLFYYVGSGRVAVLDPVALARLSETAQDVVTGLGLPDGAFHVELFDLPTGPMLLEVAVPQRIPVVMAEIRIGAPCSLARQKVPVVLAPHRVRRCSAVETLLGRVSKSAVIADLE